MLFLCSLVLLITMTSSVVDYNSNEFDTESADCPRVRKAWTSLSAHEKKHYVSAMLELRKNGGGDVLKDELIAVGSAHQDDYGEVVHTASSYLFWHNYLLWELESRIRALGGQYKCFAVPYWDFSTESSREKGSGPLILRDEINFLGGLGDPDDGFTVNGYSWDVSVADWWVPTHCFAEGDEYPLCSLKRSTSMVSEMDAQQIGRGIIEHTDFTKFSRWYSDTFNLPHNLLTDDESLWFPVVTSYDPVWYIFHSMVSYHQGIWQDCHDYDQIAPENLDNYPHAYSTYCDSEDCGDMSLDGVMYYGGNLQQSEWSFVHSHDLTIRKCYHQPRWNVIYDLDDGTGFYKDSGLAEFCKGNLNPTWFKINEKAMKKQDTSPNNMESVVNEPNTWLHKISYSNSTIFAMVFFMVFMTIAFAACCIAKNDKSTQKLFTKSFEYGSV